jgi:transcriptional regulator with XRE-family HTH domain
MAEISREQRKELARRAREIYRARAGHGVPQIAAAIAEQLPQLLPLEVLRLAHGWTRNQVVELIAKVYTDRGLPAPLVNVAMLCKWEHGKRGISADYEQALCQLYGVDREQLRHGVAHPIEDTTQGDDPMRRRTLLTTAGLTIPLGIIQAFDDALAVPRELDRPEDVPQVRARLQAARKLFDTSALAALMSTLPATIEAARGTAERVDTPASWALLSATYDLATDTLNKIGLKSTARITADRSVMCSARSQDPAAIAASARALGMMLRTTGRYELAAKVVDGAASRLETAGLRTPAQAAMFVRLLCTSAYSASGAGDRTRALDRLAEAERAARRLPALPTQTVLPFVRLYRVNLYYTLGDPGAALHAAQVLHERMYPTPERKARLWTDVARAAWPVGDLEQTVQALLAAHAHAPAEVRERPRIRRIAAELVERHPRVDGVPALAAAIGRRTA